LGSGRYEFERTGGVRTATEVVSEQSDLYQSMQKHAKVLGAALHNLARTLLIMAGYKEPGEIKITFDDSIIQDKSTIRAEAREEVSAGLMSKQWYLVNVRGLSDDQAEEELQRIRSESGVTAATVDFFGALGSGNA
jgi:A118 family predicted phage portal protein